MVGKVTDGFRVVLAKRSRREREKKKRKIGVDGYLVNTGSLEPIILTRHANRAHVDTDRNTSRLTASDGMAWTVAALPVDKVLGEPPPPLEAVELFAATESLNEFIKSFGLI